MKERSTHETIEKMAAHLRQYAGMSPEQALHTAQQAAQRVARKRQNKK